MAGQSSSDKTEQPTQKRIKDARKKGQVAKSEECSKAATLVAVVLCLWSASDIFIEDIENLMLSVAYLHLNHAEMHGTMTNVGRTGLVLLVKISLIIAGAAALAALFVNYLQVGAILAPEAVQPKLSRLNPAEKIKKIFSKDSVVQLLKSIIKILLLALILTMAVYANIPTLFSLFGCNLGCILPVAGKVTSDVMTYALLVFIIVAIIDLFLSRRKYIKDMMMTKDEVKREFKESEGDPHIKGKRKQLFQEIVNSQQMNNVKRSSVIITNPTQVAIGLRYDEEEVPLPTVTFHATGTLAERMIAVAQKEGIPVMQNVPLARALLEQSRVDDYIPQELIKPVAEVLKVIRDIR